MGKAGTKVPGSRKSRYKDLSVGASLVCLRDSTGMKAAGEEGWGELQDMKPERPFHIGLQATRRTLNFVLHVMGNSWKVWAGEYMIWIYDLGIVWWGRAKESNWERGKKSEFCYAQHMGSHILHIFSNSHDCLFLSFYRLVPTCASLPLHFRT